MSIKQNRFRAAGTEYGVLMALFDDIPEAMVTCQSGAQQAFDAAYKYIHDLHERVEILEDDVESRDGDPDWLGHYRG